MTPEHLTRMQRAAAKAREHRAKARRREVIRESAKAHPRCTCALTPATTDAELRALAGGCTPQWVCPRLAAVRRMLS